MSYQNGLCPHGHKVSKVRVGLLYGHHDPHIWTVERRPLDVCALCREQDDGRPLQVYVDHERDPVRETIPISVAAGMTGGAA